MDTNLKDIEIFLAKTVFPELERRRSGFDKPHTIAVVHFIKEIVKNTPSLELDLVTLVISAYAHDCGYADFFEKGDPLDYQRIQPIKKDHMRLGAQKLKKLLQNNIFASLTDKQKKRCVHLVSIHDQLEKLKDNDELVLMEADTLGCLDTDFVKPTFSLDATREYIDEIRRKRIPNFTTEYSKKKIEALIKKRLDFYKEKG